MTAAKFNYCLIHSDDIGNRWEATLGNLQYAAFISYAHADEAIAKKIHHALETYRIPKGVEVNPTNKLKPVFRDTAELTAHHSLTEKIQMAVRNSKFLIVICSPAAKQSHWVNEEIRLFRKLHGEASILCVICEGAPSSAFPPALLENGREPLAANIAGGRDKFRLGVNQLTATMLGIGLDELVRRDVKRRKNRAQVVTFSALVFSGAMGGMAWTAMNARDAAETSRTEAEKMVEFMLTDLKDDLKTVGKLNILDDVGKRVADYYDAIPFSDMDDDRLARQARARHLLGQVALSERNRDKALIDIRAAYNATQEILRRRPDDADAIYAHAQSEYWMGELKKQAEDFDATLVYWLEYDRLAKTLYEMDRNKLEWITESAFGENNLGTINTILSRYPTANTNFANAITLFNDGLTKNPESKMIEYELANALAGQANTAKYLGLIATSKKLRLKQIEIYTSRLNLEPKNYEYIFRLAQAKIAFMDDFPKDNTDKHIIDIFSSLKILVEADSENIKWGGEYVRFIADTINAKTALSFHEKKKFAVLGQKYIETTGFHQDFETAHNIFIKFLKDPENR